VLFDIIEGAQVPVTRLTKIFRQADDSGIPYAAEAINNGQNPSWGTLGGVDFVEVGEGEDSVVDCLHETLRQVCERLPSEGIAPRDIQVLVPQKKKGVGVEALNRALKVRLNPSDYSPTPIGNDYEVHPGDRVIHTRNDYDLEVFNGEIGVVVHASPGGVTAAMLKGVHRSSTDTQTITVVVQFDDGRQIGYTALEARQLHLAYAVTGHKFQGSQTRAAVVVAHSIHAWTLTRAWTYTAMTRAADRLVVVGQEAAVAKAAGNLDGTERNTTLQAQMR
jgi:exodeoxyribonuclease V alpha subunit